MSTKWMSPEEFAEWSESHTPAEVEQRARELQGQLADELRESTGVSREDYEHALPSEREMVVEAGIQQWGEDAEAAAEAEPVEVGITQYRFNGDEGIEIDLPANSKLSAMIERGLTRTTLDDDSEEAGTLAQAEFVALTPEFTVNKRNGDLLRDRVIQNGGRYFTVENLTEAFRELVAERQIELPYDF